MSPSFGASGKLCFVIVAFPRYLYSYVSLHLCMVSQYRDQTWFFMHYHSPGPEEGVENRGRKPRFQHPKGTWRKLMH